MSGLNLTRYHARIGRIGEGVVGLAPVPVYPAKEADDALAAMTRERDELKREVDFLNRDRDAAIRDLAAMTRERDVAIAEKAMKQIAIDNYKNDVLKLLVDERDTAIVMRKKAERERDALREVLINEADSHHELMLHENAVGGDMAIYHGNREAILRAALKEGESK